MPFPRKASPRASARVVFPAALLLMLAAAACALLAGAGARPASANSADANSAGAASAAASEPPQTGLIDVTPSGASAFLGVYRPSAISADGRFVVFSTAASDISPLDQDGSPFFENFGDVDVFVRDRRAGRTALVSVNAAGTNSGDGASSSPAISPDGRFVAFVSSAGDLVSPNPGGPFGTNVYLRDLHTNTTVLVSRNASGARGNGSSGLSAGIGDTPNVFVSADGRYVSFVSDASDLVAGDNNSRRDAFVRDVQLGVTHLVSVNQAGTASGDRETSYAVMTPNGRFVAFRSEARDLAPGLNGPGTQIFLRDIQAGTTKLVSANRFDGSAGNGSADTRGMGDLDLSDDGRYVAFVSGANDLVPGDANGTDGDASQDVFVRDTVSGTTQAASVNKTGTGTGAGHSGALAMTPDGRFVAFVSTADDLVAGDANALPDVFLRDLQAGTTSVVTVNTSGAAAGVPNKTCENVFLPILFYPFMRPSVSDDGRHVAFRSAADGLSATPDTNCPADWSTPQNGYDVFVRDMQAGSTRMISANLTGTDAGDRASGQTWITPDGRHVLFTSWAQDLVGNDTNSPHPDVFVGVNLPAAGRARFAQQVFNGVESAGEVTVTVTRSAGATGPATVAYRTLGGTASAGEYTPAEGTLTFAAGESEKQFDIAVFDDALDEDDDTVYVQLTDEAGGSVGEPSLAAVRIADDEPSPRLSISDARVGEGDGGATDLTFLLTLSEPSPRLITATVSTHGVTATPNLDFITILGTYIFPPGATRGLLKVRVRPDTAAEPDETVLVVLSHPANVEIEDDTGVGTIVDDDGSAAFTKVRLSAGTFEVSETTGRLDVEVTRSGDLSAGSSVGYATSDFIASGRSDFVGAAGALRFAPGEASKTLTVFVTNDRFTEGDEQFFLSLFDPSGCTLGAPASASVTIKSDDTADAQSPMRSLSESAFFVRQQYRDFLGRDPDDAGLAHWTNEIESCGADAACREVRRINVSAAFFLSIEFQETGYLVYRARKAAFGNLLGRPVPVQHFWFLHEAQQIGRGVVVNQGDWRGQLEQNKRDFFEEFVRGELFTLFYPESVTPAQLVAAFDFNAGGVLTQAERDALADALATGARTRAQVLRAVAEHPELARRETNRAFVLMQYFGYLRRDPDAAPEPGRNFAGYNHWLAKLEEFGGNFVNAEMVKAFLNSEEYIKRFGQ